MALDLSLSANESRFFLGQKFHLFDYSSVIKNQIDTDWNALFTNALAVLLSCPGACRRQIWHVRPAWCRYVSDFLAHICIEPPTWQFSWHTSSLVSKKCTLDPPWRQFTFQTPPLKTLFAFQKEWVMKNWAQSTKPIQSICQLNLWLAPRIIVWAYCTNAATDKGAWVCKYELRGTPALATQYCLVNQLVWCEPNCYESTI